MNLDTVSLTYSWADMPYFECYIDFLNKNVVYGTLSTPGHANIIFWLECNINCGLVWMLLAFLIPTVCLMMDLTNELIIFVNRKFEMSSKCSCPFLLLQAVVLTLVAEALCMLRQWWLTITMMSCKDRWCNQCPWHCTSCSTVCENTATVGKLVE